MAKSQRKAGMSQLKRSTTKGKTRGSATRGISQMTTRSTSTGQKSRKGPLSVGGGLEGEV